MGAAQQVVDAVDPINYGFASAQNAIVLHEVVGGGSVLPDQVIPNTVAGAPLSGTEPLIRALGLPTITNNTPSQPPGVRGAVRFIVGDHGSLLSPTPRRQPPRKCSARWRASSDPVVWPCWSPTAP
jgi:hypothetical protein